MKLPSIEGREIVPVRLIPLITNAWLGQETLPGIIANRVKVSGWPFDSDYDQIEVGVYDEETDCTERTMKTRADLIGPQKRENGVTAYHLNDDGKPVKMWASEWDVIYREISVLEAVLRTVEEKNGVSQSMESAWRLKATKILPPGVFLWRDDLDSLWKAHISYFIPMPNEPPDFRKMNYDAYIRPEYRELVCEGFEHLSESRTTLAEHVPLQRYNSIEETSHLHTATPSQPPTRRSNLPDRKGMAVPNEKRRKEEDFTRVIKSLFNQLMEEGNPEILKPGNPSEFLKCLKKRMVGLYKMEDGCTTYGELIEWVKTSPADCVKMQKPRVVRGSQIRVDKP